MDRIDLAHVGDFVLGSLIIQPATRTIVDSDNRPEVLEPRVMQVLVALARAGGSILSRHDLTQSCWEGRVVGEDAINRVISRLRRVAEGPGAGSFRIETVTKVGYRLIGTGDEIAIKQFKSAPIAPYPSPMRVPAADRRLVIGSMMAGAAAIAGTAWLALPRQRTIAAVPPRVAELMAQGADALRTATSEGNAAAIGTFKKVTELEPLYADGWGSLALSYAIASHYRDPQTVAEMNARATAAIRRALELDAENGYAQAARGWILPRNGHWRDVDSRFLKGLRDHPTDDQLANGRAALLMSVGRNREAADLLTATLAVATMSPWLLYSQVLALWASNRFEETDTALERARALYPLHFALWFARVYIAMHSGRLRDAIALIENSEDRPRAVPEAEYDALLKVAQAMLSGEPAAKASVIAHYVDEAHKGAGYAENTIQFAAAMGDLDTAFAVAEAYFFSRGFDVPALRFAGGQRTYSRLEDRRTFILFLPSTKRMRADDRFEPLVREIGLSKYWQESGTRPDYRIA